MKKMLLASLVTLAIAGCSSKDTDSVLQGDSMIGTFEPKALKMQEMTIRKDQTTGAYLMDKHHISGDDTKDHPLIKMTEPEVVDFFEGEPGGGKDGVYYLSPTEIMFKPTVYIQYPNSSSIFVRENGGAPIEWVRKE